MPRKMTSVRLEEDFLRAVRHKAIDVDLSLQEVVQRLLQAWLDDKFVLRKKEAPSE